MTQPVTTEMGPGDRFETKQESTEQCHYVFEQASNQATFLYFSSHTTSSFSVIYLSTFCPHVGQYLSYSPKVKHVLPSCNAIEVNLK